MNGQTPEEWKASFTFEEWWSQVGRLNHRRWGARRLAQIAWENGKRFDTAPLRENPDRSKPGDTL